MRVLLSIKPEFAEKIFDGTKKYEFRRVIFKDPRVEKVIVYASSPYQFVMGEFDIDFILQDKIEKVWEQTHDLSGISEDYYFRYFENREIAYAIKIGKVRRYENAKSLDEYAVHTPPQSFIYI